MATPTNNFDLPKGSYISFDATSLRQLILDRLNEQTTFTDQNYVGSNLASIIDIISFSFNTLLFYLNKTSTESMFSESQIYENINRIVKVLDYSPIGFQTSTLAFVASANTLSQGIYTIPRYSYVTANGAKYCFNQDVTFTKTLTAGIIEIVPELDNKKLLLQGSYQEYPLYNALGESGEVLVIDSTSNIDHFNIDVYVNSVTTGEWVQYTKTSSLYLENSVAEKYEIRLNGSKQYEITFGNDINGRQLIAGDKVAIYYLQSDGTAGEVGALAFNGVSPQLFSSTQYDNIISNVINTNQVRLIASTETQYLKITNNSASTQSTLPETPDQIRSSAPASFRSQYRLVTESDYENYIKTNYTNIISNVRVVNNTTYTTEYLQYFYNLGIVDPTLTDRALFNQIQYADACNFNNVYLIIIPNTSVNSLGAYVLPAQKELIQTSLVGVKGLTTEVSFVDPVYKSVAIGVKGATSTLSVTDERLCQLVITKTKTSIRDDIAIINDVVSIFTTYFSKQNLSLGQVLDINSISQQIIGVDGVDTFKTTRTDTGESIPGLSLFVWNPDYPSADGNMYTTNNTLRFFEYPYLYDWDNLSSKIVVA